MYKYRYELNVGSRANISKMRLIIYKIIEFFLKILIWILIKKSIQKTAMVWNLVNSGWKT